MKPTQSPIHVYIYIILYSDEESFCDWALQLCRWGRNVSLLGESSHSLHKTVSYRAWNVLSALGWLKNPTNPPVLQQPESKYHEATQVLLSLAVLNATVVKMQSVTWGKGSISPAIAAQQQGKISNGGAAVGLADHMQPQFYQVGEKAMKVMHMVLGGLQKSFFFSFGLNLSSACWSWQQESYCSVLACKSDVWICSTRELMSVTEGLFFPHHLLLIAPLVCVAQRRLRVIYMCKPVRNKKSICCKKP